MWSTIVRFWLPLLALRIRSGDGAQVPVSSPKSGINGIAFKNASTEWYGSSNADSAAAMQNSNSNPATADGLPRKHEAEIELEATPQPDNDNPIELGLTTSHDAWKRSSKAKEEGGKDGASIEEERKEAEGKKKKGKKKTKVADKENRKEVTTTTTKKPRPKSVKGKKKAKSTSPPRSETNSEKEIKDGDNERTESGVQTIKHILTAFEMKDRPIPEEVQVEADKVQGKTEKENLGKGKVKRKPKPKAEDKGQGQGVAEVKPKPKLKSKVKPKEKSKGSAAKGKAKTESSAKPPAKLKKVDEEVKTKTEEKKPESKPKPKGKAKGTRRPKATPKPKPESKEVETGQVKSKPRPKSGKAKTKAKGRSKRTMDIQSAYFEPEETPSLSSASGSLKKTQEVHRVKRDSRATNTASFFANLPRIQFSNTYRMGRIRSVDDNSIVQEAKTVPPYLFRPHEKYLDQPFHFDMRVMSNQESGDENEGLGLVTHNRVKRFGQPSTKALYRHRAELFLPSGKKKLNRPKRSLGSPCISDDEVVDICFDLVRERCLNVSSPLWLQEKHVLDVLKRTMLSLMKDSRKDTYNVVSETLSWQLQKCHLGSQQLAQAYNVLGNGYSPLVLPEMYPDFIGSNEIDTGEPLVRLKRFKRQLMNKVEYKVSTEQDSLLHAASTLLFHHAGRICSDYFIDPAILERELNQLLRVDPMNVAPKHDMPTPEYRMAIDILRHCLVKY